MRPTTRPIRSSPQWIAVLVFLAGSVLPARTAWKPCGPSESYDASSIAIDARDSRNVFVTGLRKPGRDSDAWATADGGASWHPVRLGASAQAVPDWITIGKDGRAYAAKGRDLYRAQGGGWMKLGTIDDPQFPLDRVSALSFAATSRHLLAGLGNQFSKQSGGLFLSADGRSWTAVPALVGLAVYDILVVDDDAATVLVATHRGVHRTRDGGATWTALGPAGVGARIRDLALDLRTGSIFAGTSGDGIWKSADGGDTWSASSDGLERPAVYAIEVDLARENVVWAGLSGGGAYRSADGGRSWTPWMDGLAPGTSVWSIQSTRARPDQPIASTASGVYCWSAE
jgi:photosystem II stability/assembly factor-like uncharacterized protein